MPSLARWAGERASQEVVVGVTPLVGLARSDRFAHAPQQDRTAKFYGYLVRVETLPQFQQN